MKVFSASKEFVNQTPSELEISGDFVEPLLVPIASFKPILLGPLASINPFLFKKIVKIILHAVNELKVKGMRLTLGFCNNFILLLDLAEKPFVVALPQFLKALEEALRLQ